MNKTLQLTLTAVLIAVGIVIPMVMPKIVVEPASFTLASHVAIFLAVFISPWSAVSVCLGTTLGFLIAGLPGVIIIRAASHLLFALLGALWLVRHPDTLKSPWKLVLFGLVLSLIHGATELAVITPLYFSASELITAKTYASGYFKAIFLMVGAGTVVHSLIDYTLAILVWQGVGRAVRLPKAKTAA